MEFSKFYFLISKNYAIGVKECTFFFGLYEKCCIEAFSASQASSSLPELHMVSFGGGGGCSIFLCFEMVEKKES